MMTVLREMLYIHRPFPYNTESNPAGPAISGPKFTILTKEQPMGKPNFNFQKRQREIAKQKKNEEKRQRKLEKNAEKPAEGTAPAAGQAPEAAEEKTGA
jgi:hypothetical protein